MQQPSSARRRFLFRGQRDEPYRRKTREQAAAKRRAALRRRLGVPRRGNAAGASSAGRTTERTAPNQVRVKRAGGYSQPRGFIVYGKAARGAETQTLAPQCRLKTRDYSRFLGS
jgi:hypothetical protein